MVQSVTLVSLTSFSFSFEIPNPNPSSSSMATFRSDRQISLVKRNIHRAPICAAVAEASSASPVLEMRRSESLYEVLRIKQNASAGEIKAAYRTLAKMYHPDAVSDPEEPSDGLHFIEIHDAYATLSDPSARALYDLKLSVGSRRRRSGRSMDGFRVNRAEYYSTRRWETDQCW